MCIRDRTATDIATNMNGARDIEAADMDGDGDLDIVAVSQNDDTLAWYENTCDGSDPIVLDLDGDGIELLGIGSGITFDIDADGMGRAFPEFHMKTFFVYGVPYVPMVLADEKGNIAVIPQALTGKWVERIARAITIQIGSVACNALAPITAQQVRNTSVQGSLTLSKKLGDSVRKANQTKSDPVQAILEVNPGKVLFEGKISGIQRKTTQGFARGNVTIDGSGKFLDSVMEIEFQNENLIARIHDEIVCVVPDLISIVDSEKGDPITTELLRYGFRAVSYTHLTLPTILLV